MLKLVLKVRGAGRVWLVVRDGVVVGATGCEPRKYIGTPLAAVLAWKGHKVCS